MSSIIFLLCIFCFQSNDFTSSYVKALIQGIFQLHNERNQPAIENLPETRMILISTLTTTHVVRLTLYNNVKGKLSRIVHVSRALNQENFVMAVLFVLTFAKNIPGLSEIFDSQSQVSNKLSKQQNQAIQIANKTLKSKVKTSSKPRDLAIPEESGEQESKLNLLITNQILKFYFHFC